MVLNLLNLYSLMFSFIYKINSKERPLRNLKIKNETAAAELAALQTFWSSYQTINTTNDLEGIFKPQATSITIELLSRLFNTTGKIMKCYNVTVNCTKLWPTTTTNTIVATTFLIMNLTSPTIIPTTPAATAQPSQFNTTTSRFSNFSIIDSNSPHLVEEEIKKNPNFKDVSYDYEQLSSTTNSLVDDDQMTVSLSLSTPANNNESDALDYYDYLDEMPRISTELSLYKFPLDHRRKQRNAKNEAKNWTVAFQKNYGIDWNTTSPEFPNDIAEDNLTDYDRNRTDRGK